MEHTIKSPDFDLCLQLKIYEADIACPSNTILTISLRSDGFSANANMDVDIKEFVTFVDSLSSLYTTLKGVAILQEPFDKQQFIEFRADRSGHICIRGRLNSNGRKGFVQELSFENRIDQTYLPDFIKSLSLFCTKYR